MKIYTVEVTNHCNSKCEYCPHPKMTRSKGFMSVETFKKVLKKQELDFMELHGFGEPLMHPQIYDFVRMAHERGFKTQFSTNGLLLSREVMDKLVDSGLNTLWISIRPFFDIVKPKMEELYDEYSKKMEIVIYYVEYPEKMQRLPSGWKVTNVIPHSWSSQVRLSFVKSIDKCFNLKNSAVTVLWDGRVSNCCHDFDGKYIIGSIDDEGLKPKPNELCKECEFYG